MALNSTPRRRFGVALGVVLTGVAAGFIGFTGVASAHTPNVSAECKGDTTTLTVNLQAYINGSKQNKSNHVTVTDNGSVLADTAFQTSFQQDFKTSGTEKHDFLVTYTAWDDQQYSGHKEKVVEACMTPPSTSTSEAPPETTTEAPPTTTTTEAAPVVETSTSPAPPAAQGGPLAETGASIGLPLGIAGVLIVGGVVALFVVRRRSSNNKA